VLPKANRYDLGVLYRVRRFFSGQKIEALITYGFTADSWARVAARMAGVPVIISSVRTSSEDIWMIHHVNRMLASSTSHFIANSQAVADYLLDTINVSNRNISIIPNGIDVSRFGGQPTRDQVRRSLGLDPNAFAVGIVSRLSPEKNVEGFVRIAHQLSHKIPQARFVIVGDGPEMPSLKALSETLGMSDLIQWLGERDDVPVILNSLDVAMLTSFREGLSNAILEYMASGLPVVASAVGGNPELIRHNETGFIYPVTDLNSAVDYLYSLFSDADLRNRIRSSGRQVAVRDYSIAAMVSKTQSLLLQLLKEPDTTGDRIMLEIALGDRKASMQGLRGPGQEGEN
jgi:glycosyltransferase involved in cell wall biosynthesis